MRFEGRIFGRAYLFIYFFLGGGGSGGGGAYYRNFTVCQTKKQTLNC